MRTTAIFLGLAAAGLAAGGALAHHSSAMFDGTKTVTVAGDVKQYQFVQPHTWIDVVAKDASGKETLWSVEGGATGQMRNIGLPPSALKPGDHVTVTIHPLRDGRPAGSFISIVMPDGRTLSARNPQAAPAPATP
jgi:hypothetical protein